MKLRLDQATRVCCIDGDEENVRRLVPIAEEHERHQRRTRVVTGKTENGLGVARSRPADRGPADWFDALLAEPCRPVL